MANEIFVRTNRCAGEYVGSNEPINAIALSVSYYKGRGIYLHCGKVHTERGVWSTVIDFNPRTNSTLLLEKLSRGNAKKLTTYTQVVTEHGEEIANAFIDYDLDRIFDIVGDAVSAK